MTEERFWLLFSLKLSGEASPEELAELQSYLQDHPEVNWRTGMMDNMWEAAAPSTEEQKEAAFNKHLQRLSNHFAEPVLQYEADIIAADVPVKKKPSRSVYKMVAWISGVAAVIFLVFFAIQYRSGSQKTSGALAQNMVSTKRGSKTKIQLPDGTEVWLNADSRISYNENFQDKIREVHLSGEAFFDVVRDEARPFIIHTNVIDVKVLGTAFNVRSYDNEKNTETSLIRGSVEITLRSNPDKKIILKPNDKLIVDNSEANAERDPAQAKKNRPSNRQVLLTLGKVSFREAEGGPLETLWVKNTLAFDKESLEEIALKIERWYDVKVNIKDDRIKRTEYSGIFANEDIDQVMEALRLSGNLHYEINKKEVNIWP